MRASAASVVAVIVAVLALMTTGCRRHRAGVAHADDALVGVDDENDAGHGVFVDDTIAGVVVAGDVAYGADTAQRLDVYRPATAPATPSPIIVMAHGGGWRRGDKRARGVVQHKVEAWVPKGLVFVSVNYRMDPPRPDVEADDVAAATAFVQAHAGEWGGDPARVLLMGHSAGAHLVTLVVVDHAIADAAGMKPVVGVVSLDSGSIDVVANMSRKHFGLYDIAFGTDPAYWAKVSPMHRLSSKSAPIMVVCSKSRLDACPQGRRLAEKAAPLGGRVEVYPVDLGHGGINLELGQASAYTSAVEAFMASVGIGELGPQEQR